jgi:hypothetical protein
MLKFAFKDVRKVYFTGNKTIYIQTNCTGGLYNYMTLSIFPCCYYVHCMFVFHIVNHCNMGWGYRRRIILYWLIKDPQRA